MSDRSRSGDQPAQDEASIAAHLVRGLAELNQPASSLQLGQLSQLVLLLSDWGTRINLTGHRDPINMATRLVLDASALCGALPELRKASSLVDLGSGAGFPGLPIAILHPHLVVRLIESRLKRNHFQRAARRLLQLQNVEPMLGRSDELDVQPAEIVVAQAMAQPSRALEMMLPWASSGGLLALPASHAAPQPKPPAGLGSVEARLYQLPGLGLQRKLWIARAPTA